MPQLAYTMHRCLVPRHQEDALLVGEETFQSERLPIQTRTSDAEDLLLAVADGVGSSPVPARATPGCTPWTAWAVGAGSPRITPFSKG